MADFKEFISLRENSDIMGLIAANQKRSDIDVSQIISLGESDTVEFTESISDKKGIAQAMAAFSTTNGGRILIGVSDDGTIVGVKQKEEVSDTIVDLARTAIDSPIAPKIFHHIIRSEDIIEVLILEGTDKPYSAHGVYYKRIGKSNRRMSKVELKKYYPKLLTSFITVLEEHQTKNRLLKSLKDRFFSNFSNEQRK